MASLTPASRQASIWQTSIAPAWKQLLEDHAVLHVLAGGDAHGRDLAPDAGVAQDVVGAGRLLDPPGVEARSCAIASIASSTPHAWLASIISLRSGPSAPRISAGAPHVVVEVAADLHLDVVEAARDGVAHERLDLGVVVAEPAGRRGVGGVPVARKSASRAARPGSCRSQQLDGLAPASARR